MAAAKRDVGDMGLRLVAIGQWFFIAGVCTARAIRC
jgi:hypothetical protein